MKKNAILVTRIINLWDHDSFLIQFAAETGPIYEQQLPPKKYQHSKPHQRDPNASAPHYKEKAHSKHPNSASRMTGGKAPQVHDKLAAKAAHGSGRKYVAYKLNYPELQ